MPASYPGAVVVFTTKHNVTDTVDAADPNSIQAEVTALESTIGTNPHVGVSPNPASYVTPTTFASLSARVANLEHGLVADTHSQYVKQTGGSTIAPAAGTTGLVIQAPASQTVDNFTIKSTGGTALLTHDHSTDQVVLSAPIISSFSNSQHSHAAASSGGSLNQSATHGSPDTDGSTSALHHTLGSGANQAAAGNHLHTGTYSAVGHSHAESDITSLVTDLSNKASVSHNHTGTYANSSHSHVESDVSSLVSDLAGKASSGHGHTVSGLSGISRAEQAITTDSTGKVTISHGLGSTPTAVVATNLSTGGGANTGMQVGNFTSTTFDLYLINTTTGVTAKNTGASVCWIAMT